MPRFLHGLAEAGLTPADVRWVLVAAGLHADLDAFVKMAPHEPGLPELITAILKHLRERLRAHGYVLPDRVQDELLALDVGLNAKGLFAWRQKAG